MQQQQEQELSELQMYIQEMNDRMADLEGGRQTVQGQYAQNIFGSPENDNLVKWQLDIKEELERIEHLLRKHVPKIDENGNEYYSAPEDGEELFNEKGVNEILNLLAWYLNKNIILSNFSEEQIDLRMQQLGNELTNFIFNNYEDFGLTTKDKIKHYPIVVMNIVNTIEAAYYRALNGGERESLRTARTVTQSEPIGGHQLHPSQFSNQRRFNFFRPTTWGAGGR